MPEKSCWKSGIPLPGDPGHDRQLIDAWAKKLGLADRPEVGAIRHALLSYGHAVLLHLHG
jgi:hypothetical protein